VRSARCPRPRRRARQAIQGLVAKRSMEEGPMTMGSSEGGWYLGRWFAETQHTTVTTKESTRESRRANRGQAMTGLSAVPEPRRALAWVNSRPSRLCGYTTRDKTGKRGKERAGADPDEAGRTRAASDVTGDHDRNASRGRRPRDGGLMPEITDGTMMTDGLRGSPSGRRVALPCARDQWSGLRTRIVPARTEQ